MIPQDPLFNTPLNEYHLSAGTAHSLMREGINTLGQLYLSAENSCISLTHGIGKQRQEEIYGLLKKIYDEKKALHPELLHYMDIFPEATPLSALSDYPGDILDVSIRMLSPRKTTEKMLVSHDLGTFGKLMAFPFGHIRLDDCNVHQRAEIGQMRKTIRAFLQNSHPEALSRCGDTYNYHIDPEDDLKIEELGMRAALVNKLSRRGVKKASELNRVTRQEFMNWRTWNLTGADADDIMQSLAAFYYIPRYDRSTGKLEQENSFAPWVRHTIIETARYLGVHPIEVADCLGQEKARMIYASSKNVEISGGGGVPAACIEEIFCKKLKKRIQYNLFGRINNTKAPVMRRDLLLMLPDFLQNPDKLMAFLAPLIDGEWIRETRDNSYVPAGNSFKNYLERDLNSRDATIVKMKLKGVYREEIERKLEIGEQECRDHFRKAMQMKPLKLQDDFYLPVFQNTKLTWETFHHYFPAESELTYQYLTYETRGLTGRKKFGFYNLE